MYKISLEHEYQKCVKFSIEINYCDENTVNVVTEFDLTEWEYDADCEAENIFNFLKDYIQKQNGDDEGKAKDNDKEKNKVIGTLQFGPSSYIDWTSIAVTNSYVKFLIDRGSFRHSYNNSFEICIPLQFIANELLMFISDYVKI
jgi:hypothetical protein